MKIAQSVHENLETQLAEYEKLVAFAKEKTAFLSDTKNRKPQELQQLVQKEVSVVSVLQQLESRRKKICAQRNLAEIVEEAGEFKESLEAVKARINDVASELRKVNDRNKLLLGVSIKVVRKMLQAVKDLAFPEEVTYSRVQKGSKVHSYNSVNLTA